jgi:hypothetical protein
MSVFRSDSFCGQYCGACDILVAFRNGIDTGVKPGWKSLPTELGNLPVKHNTTEIKCFGCKTDIVFGGCAKCIIRKCAMGKQIAGTCLDCKRYPCWRFKLTTIVRKISGIEKNLPHLRYIDANISAIKQIGLESWIKEQDEKWQCRQCGQRLTWYRESCDSCKSPAT